MLSPVLWLSPASADLLRSVSKLLRGEVPCPPSKLANLLKDADAASQCEGLLSDASIRASFAKALEGKKAPKELCDATASSLVELFGSVLEEQMAAIKTKAKDISKALPGGNLTTATFMDIQSKLPKETAGKSALKWDWLVWHSVGCAHDSKALPALDQNVFKERVGVLAACGEAGSLADAAVAMHVLENLQPYIAWETGIPGSKVVQEKNQEVITPFDKAKTLEVAVRRVLGGVLPVEVATTAAAKWSSAQAKVLDELVASAKAKVVIPLYSAPPAPAEPKAAKDKAGGDKSNSTGGKGDKKADAAAPAKVGEGTLGALRAATASQELQMHLLRYRLFPGTTLSAAPSPSVSAQAAAPALEQKRLEGFAALWAPCNSSVPLPPGHTSFSWQHVKADNHKEGFSRLWAAAENSTVPPGHTQVSWTKGGYPGAGAGPAAAAAPSPAKSSGDKGGKKDVAPTAPKNAKAAAPAPAKPAGAAPPEGSLELALCKLDIRCGRIMTCKKVPDSEKLFLLSVNIGDEEPRQVITGLQKFYKEEDLTNRFVIVYCNIKPGKLAGYESQAMVLAATTDKGTDKEICQLLAPPKDTPEGTKPICNGTEVGSTPASNKNISKVWGQVQPLLVSSDSCLACCDGNVLQMPNGPISTGTMKGASIS